MSITISGAEFVRRLFSQSDSLRRHENTVVTSLVHLGGKMSGKVKDLNVKGVVFNEMVMLEKFIEGDGACILSDCTFLGGIHFQYAKCRHLSFAGSRAKHIDLGLGNQFDTLSFRDLEVEDELDISGTTVASVLRINDVRVPNLVLFDEKHPVALQAKCAETDNPVFAHQLHMAGIPVYVSTAVARATLTMSADSGDLSALERPTLAEDWQ